MEPRQIDSHSIQLEDISKSFFAPAIWDNSYNHVEWRKFPPIHSLTSEPISFVCPGLRSGSIYLVQNMILSMKLVLETNQGHVLPPKSETAPANYILNSYFSGSQVFFNGLPLNSSKDFHNYKAMLFSTITNNQSEFMAPLEAAGYVFEGAGYEDTAQSGSFQIRANWFRSDTSNKIYHKNPVPFCGALITDLTTADVGCPPGVELRIDLYRAPQEVVIDSFDGSSKNPHVSSRPDYKLTITEIYLHIGVGQMGSSAFASFQSHLKSDVAYIRFRRYVLRTLDIATDSLSHSSDILFSQTEIPSRIFCGFIQTSVFRGKFEKSFFVFKSKFGSESETVFNHQAETIFRNERPRHGRNEFGIFRNFLRYAFNSITNSDNENPPEIDIEEGVVPPGFHFRSEPVIAAATVQTNEDVYVKSCILTLNGRPLTTLSTIDATKENGSPENFFQFCQVTGMDSKSGFSAGLSLKDYRDVYHWYSFDLTSSNRAANMAYVPACRFGYYRIETQFSSNTKSNLQMIVIAEYPSQVTIDHNGKISRSYAT